MTTIDSITQLHTQYLTPVLDFLVQHWKANITLKRVSIQLKNQKDCPDTTLTGYQRNLGHCGECRYFLGSKPGDPTTGCCGLLVGQKMESNVRLANLLQRQTEKQAQMLRQSERQTQSLQPSVESPDRVRALAMLEELKTGKTQAEVGELFGVSGSLVSAIMQTLPEYEDCKDLIRQEQANRREQWQLERRLKMFDLIQQGKNLKDIAEQFYVSTQLVRIEIDKLPEYRAWKESLTHNHPQLTPDPEQSGFQLLQLRREARRLKEQRRRDEVAREENLLMLERLKEGKTQAEIAQEFDFSQAAVSQRLRSLPEYHEWKAEIVRERPMKMLRLVQEGKTLQEVARLLHIGVKLASEELNQLPEYKQLRRQQLSGSQTPETPFSVIRRAINPAPDHLQRLDLNVPFAHPTPSLDYAISAYRRELEQPSLIPTARLTTLDDATLEHYIHWHLIPNYQTNIYPVVYSYGRVGLTNSEQCPDLNATGHQRSPGNCEQCRYFLGCQLGKEDDFQTGATVSACCGLKLNGTLVNHVINAAQQVKTALEHSEAQQKQEPPSTFVPAFPGLTTLEFHLDDNSTYTFYGVQPPDSQR